MDYSPGNPYWETEDQILTLKFWMRTPFYSDNPIQAHEQRWYMKGPHDTKPCSVTRDYRTGKIVRGAPINHTDNRFAPTGVSVVFVTYEPHNKRQEMKILLHPVMDNKSPGKVKFLSTFRQEIGPCVQMGTDYSQFYPDSACYGTNMDWFIPAQICAVRRHAFNNGPMPCWLIEELNRHVLYLRMNDEWKFVHVLSNQLMEEFLAATILVQEYKPLPETGMLQNPYKWKQIMLHPQIIPVHEIAVDGRVMLKDTSSSSGMQVCDMRKVDADTIRSILHMPTLTSELKEMTLLTPHDFAMISMKGMHFTAQAGHLGDSETRVTRRVNFP